MKSNRPPLRQFSSLVKIATAVCLLLSVSSESLAVEKSFEARRAEMKREFERKRKQMKADFEKRKAEMLSNSSSHSGTERSFDSTNSNRNTKASPKPKFVAANAPSPQACLADMVRTARKANSVTQFMKYLPDDRQESLKKRQARYDPEAAKKRKMEYRRDDPEMSEDSIAFLTNPPYLNSLNWHKSVANKIQRITSVKIDGEKATLSVDVKSDAVINGIAYPNGSATITMIGEGNLWRFSGYKESIMVSR